MGNQVVALEHKADGMVPIGVPVPITEFLGGFSVDDEVAGGIAIQTADDVQQRGLSAAALPQNRHKFILPERNVDALERMDRFLPREVVFFDAF